MDCSLPDSSVRGIFQARVLEWVAISFSRGSSQPRDLTWVSHIAGRHFTIWATREATKPLIIKPHALKESSYLWFHAFIPRVHSLWAAWRKCGLIECGGGSRGKAAGIISQLCSLEQEIWEGYISWPPHTPFTSLWILILRKHRVESAHCNYCHIGRSQKLSR